MAANLGITCTEGGTTTADGEYYPYATVDGREYWRLSCRASEEMWFDMNTNFPMHKCARHPILLAPLRRHALACCSCCPIVAARCVLCITADHQA